MASQKGKQSVALGFDDGAVVIKMGREEPAVSMDAAGKLIWAKNTEVVSAIIKPGRLHGGFFCRHIDLTINSP